MKKNQKGFSLLETLVVSAFVMTTLIFLFAQFAKIRKNYENSFNYNTVDGIYGAKNIVTFMKLKTVPDFASNFSTGTVKYINLYNSTGCSNAVGITNVSYCTDLMRKLNVGQVLIIKTIEGLEAAYKSDPNYSESINQYLKTQYIDNIDGITDTYYLIIEYKSSNLNVKSNKITLLKINYNLGTWEGINE